ncbi:MAG TPA: hypothetical protein VG826_12395 [Pirellulales bacterium]|nr:hypothetical protein [Pirellulales bacterium]
MRQASSALALLAALCCSPTLADQAESAEEAAEPAPLSSSREMLKILGVADRLNRTDDGPDFPPEGDELLWRLLASVRRFSLLDVDRWKDSRISAEELRGTPAGYRGALVTWTGEVTRAAELKLPAEAAERFNLSGFYRCEMTITGGESRAIVYALAVPEEWLSGETIHERASVSGLFIKLVQEEGESAPLPVLVAGRVAWHPHNILGDLDMDVGLFDELSPRPELGAEDRECFYQLLAAAGRAGARQLLRAVPKEGRNPSVVPLFNKPNEQRGRLVELTGTARQAVLRRVEDRDIVARFGIDHYYELEIFTQDSEGNPLTFCVRELPKGFPQGDRITEPVRVAGFFVKRWGYRTASTESTERPVTRHLAPLLIGREPIWLQPLPADQRFANGVFLVLFVCLTVVLWVVVSRLSRGDAKFHKEIERRFIASQPESLDNIDPEAEEKTPLDRPVTAADAPRDDAPRDDGDNDRPSVS